MDIETLATTTERVFENIHRRVFLGEPVANPRLKVEVTEVTAVEDTPVMILITPWTLNGMMFPPDDAFPDQLVVGAKSYPVFSHELEEVGPYFSVNLMSDVSTLQAPEAARSVASALGEPLRNAVAAVRRARGVADPGRRRLLTGEFDA
jgi:[NiFe] hydrogenase assembly HybE family chaperone